MNGCIIALGLMTPPNLRWTDNSKFSEQLGVIAIIVAVEGSLGSQVWVHQPEGVACRASSLEGDPLGSLGVACQVASATP